MSWCWKWPPWRCDEPDDGHEAVEAKLEAEQRLREARQQWPEVRRAGDVLAFQVEQAFRRPK